MALSYGLANRGPTSFKSTQSLRKTLRMILRMVGVYRSRDITSVPCSM